MFLFVFLIRSPCNKVPPALRAKVVLGLHASILRFSLFQLPWRNGLPLLPPPPRTPKSSGRAASLAPIFDFFAHLGRHRFSSFFPHLFSSMLAPSWLPKLLPNPSKIYKKSVQKLERKTCYFGDRFVQLFLIDLVPTLIWKKTQKRFEGYHFSCFREFYLKIDSNMSLTSFSHRFFIHLGTKLPSKMHHKTFQRNHQISNRFWPPSCLPCSTKIDRNGSVELKGPPYFF